MRLMVKVKGSLPLGWQILQILLQLICLGGNPAKPAYKIELSQIKIFQLSHFVETNTDLAIKSLQGKSTKCFIVIISNSFRVFSLKCRMSVCKIISNFHPHTVLIFLLFFAQKVFYDRRL